VKYSNSRRSTIAALTVAQSLSCAGAFAQTTVLEEVIVTATKRAEGLQDIPVTVNAFSAATIQEAGIQDATDVAIMTPALNISTSAISPFNSRMSVRGIGTSQTDPMLEPSVGLFVDGVFFGRSGLGMSDLVDIERIEVLQGPQGTLYGKNTNAGAISVITKAPNFEEFEAHAEASVGNYSMHRLSGSVSGPLSDSVAYRLSGTIHERDGYYDNKVGDDLNAADDWSLRGKLQWEPTDSLSILLTASHVDRDSKCCGADATQSESVNEMLVARGQSPDKNDPYDYKIQPDIDSRFEMESDLVAMTIEYDTEWGDITSITAWNDYDYSNDFDPDRSQLDVLRIIDDKYAGDSLSQELRFDATAGDNFDYMLGLFYYEQTTKRGNGQPFVFTGQDIISIGSQQDLPLPVPIQFIVAPEDNIAAKVKQDAETIAFFGQATWHIGDVWHLTGGLRWSDEEKDIDLFSETNSTAPLADTFSFLETISTPIDTTLDRSEDNVDWLIRASMDMGDDSMVFASAATGTKSGGFNSINGTPEQRAFEPEDTLTYELGVKSTLLDARLRVNATAFYSQIDDYQNLQQLPSGIGSVVTNAAEVETSGLDLQIDALPLPNLTLTAGLLYMHKYEITDGPQEGDDLPFTGDYSANLAATLVLPLGDGNIYWRTDYSYMDDHATNSSPSDQLRDLNYDDRTVLNMKLGWRNDDWNISVWGKNLTDDEYAVATSLPFILTGQDSYSLAAPRTYGATLRYDF
jgi:iron complex outermembrane receptor protein